MGERKDRHIGKLKDLLSLKMFSFKTVNSYKNVCEFVMRERNFGAYCTCHGTRSRLTKLRPAAPLRPSLKLVDPFRSREQPAIDHSLQHVDLTID